jgi:hypothetical protein
MSGRRRAHQPARDRIVSLGMMGGGTFFPLKGGQAGLESTKRAKIRLAILLKILHIAPSEDAPRQYRKRDMERLYLRRFLRSMTNLPESPVLLFKSQF